MDILSNETYKQHNNLSRYAIVPIFYNKLDKRYQPGFPMRLEKQTSFVKHEIKSGDTLDSLALYYYGNPTYYWIIADFNDILDPFLPLIVGQIINIPTFQALTFYEV